MKFGHHEYRLRPRGYAPGYAMRWQIVHEYGAVHFDAQVCNEEADDWVCGLEFHWNKGEGAPTSLDCPITKRWCWHEGTSLYAGEMWNDYGLKRYYEAGDHMAIFKALEAEVERRVADKAREAGTLWTSA